MLITNDNSTVKKIGTYMVSDIDDDNFPYSSTTYNDDSANISEPSKRNSVLEKEAQAQAQKNVLARKRIDELKEKKHLKDLLDDSEDW